MQDTIRWIVSAEHQAVQFAVQSTLDIEPRVFALSFDSVEQIYCQMLNQRVKAREALKHGVLRQ